VLWQYGLTECSRALILDARARPDKLHTVGCPTPGVEVMIADPDGAARATGESGEILLDAPQRARRYWNRPDMDRERFHGRWLRTGDIGRIDDEGFVTYLGRQDDMINCGGLSYFPAEVERELGPVPGVAEYIIAGVPDPRGVMEHVPWAFVVPETADSWTPGGFARAARDRLPPHMVPRNIVRLPSMPLIASGSRIGAASSDVSDRVERRHRAPDERRRPHQGLRMSPRSNVGSLGRRIELTWLGSISPSGSIRTGNARPKRFSFSRCVSMPRSAYA